MKKWKMVCRDMFLTVSIVAFLSMMYGGCKQPSKKDGNKEVKVTITVQGDENVASGKGGTFSVDKGTTWGVVKTKPEITGITFKDGYDLSAWKLDNGTGNVLVDTYAFNANATVFAVSKSETSPQDKVTINVDGDENVASGKGGTFSVDKGTTWGIVKAKPEITGITFKDGYDLSAWKLDNGMGNVLVDTYAFDANATVFAVSKQADKYKKVPYDKLDIYLNDEASSESINYIEVTDIPDGKLIGSSTYPFEAGGLGQILNLNTTKKVGLKLPDTINNLTDMSACFAGCTTLISVANIPNSVKKMQFCFDVCENLQEAPVIPESVEDMKGCFRNCKALQEAPVIPKNVSDLNSCFAYCENLTKAPPVIPASAKDIRYCFFGCKKLVTLNVISEGVENMQGCFTECESLVSAPAIPTTATNMRECFKDCKALKEPPASIPENVTDMKECFYGCAEMVTPPILSQGLEDMTRCFSGCEALTQAPAIPTSVTDMQGCFSDCENLITAPAIPNAVETLELCFSGCINLTTPPSSIPASVKNVSSCFNECESLNSVPSFEEGVIDMSFCFKDCTSITQGPNIPSTVENMSNTFFNCSALKKAPVIHKDAKVTDMSLCFSMCEALKDMPLIPAFVTTLEECFNGCVKLSKVSNPIPEKVVNMEGCFSGCEKLKGVVLNCAYVADSFNRAFEDCTALEDSGVKVKNVHLNAYQTNANAMGTTKEKFAAQQ